MTSLALGHYARFYDRSERVVWAIQNFFIGTQVSHQGITYVFAPFGFSGLTTNRDGALEPAKLVLPNNELSRSVLAESLNGKPVDGIGGVQLPYVVEVDVNVLDPDTNSVLTKLFTYTGQATGGGWDDTALTIGISSVFDAVSGDVPTRTLHRRLVGALPLSSNVRMR